MLAKLLIDILVCPISRDKLVINEKQNALLCYRCNLAYPIIDDIPILIQEKAKQILLEEPLNNS